MRLLLVLLAVLPARAADAFTAKFCITCHSAPARMGGFSLEGASIETPTRNPEIWEKVIKRIRAGEMPPPGAPRPDSRATAAFVEPLRAALDRAPLHAGRPVIRRLNRREYRNAIRDVLAIDLPIDAELPQDQAAGGFDNIADALSLSPLLLERYLKVARRVSDLATGTGEASPVVEIFPARGTQAAWQGEGMPIGSRGGIRVNHYFPRDGDYDLRAFLVKETLTPTEGVRFFRVRLQGVKAGAHSVVVTFPDPFAEREGPVSNVSGIGGAALGGPLDVLGTAVRPAIDFRLDGKRVKLFEISGMTAGEAAFDGQPGPPALARIEISGPFHISGPGDTPSRRRIFICRESAECPEQILRPILRRAFRRDVSAEDLDRYLNTFKQARRSADFETAIAAAIRETLIAPDFLFRLEFDAPGAAPVHPVSPFELATRLSFFLWSTIPDDELLDRASANALDLDREVRRMLADTRSSAWIENFAAQSLGLPALETIEPDRQLFPAFDRALSGAFATETRLFLGSLLRENRKLEELLTADFTYLNDRLAAHYGIAGIAGPGFRRVALDRESKRGGLLTQGSVLLLTSHSTRTSPVLRGKWILDNLLNSPPPAPPANVPPLDESPGNGRKLTAREQVERHKNKPACSGCHNRIDPLGFALENFDVIGRYRTHDEGAAIDSSTTLANGERMEGVSGLKSMLAGRREELAHATVERLLTYAVGRELDARDQPAVRRILRQTAPAGYRFQDLIAAVVQSAPFRMRQRQEP